VRVPFNYRSFTPRTSRRLDDADSNSSTASSRCREAGLWVVRTCTARTADRRDNIDDSWGYSWLLKARKSGTNNALWRKIATIQERTGRHRYDLFKNQSPHHFDVKNSTPA